MSTELDVLRRDGTGIVSLEEFYRKYELEEFLKTKSAKLVELREAFEIPHKVRVSSDNFQHEIISANMDLWTDQKSSILVTDVETFKLVQENLELILILIVKNRELYYTHTRKRFGEVRKYKTVDSMRGNVSLDSAAKKLFRPSEQQNLSPIIHYICKNSRSTDNIEVHVQKLHNTKRLKTAAEAVYRYCPKLHLEKRRLSRRKRAKLLFELFIADKKAYAAAHEKIELSTPLSLVPRVRESKSKHTNALPTPIHSETDEYFTEQEIFDEWCKSQVCLIN